MSDETNDLTKCPDNQIITVKEAILCAAPGSKGIQYKRDGGFTEMVTKRALDELTLVADAAFYGLRKGDKIYLPSEIVINSRWGTQSFDVEGVEAIVVPTNQIVAFKRVRD